MEKHRAAMPAETAMAAGTVNSNGSRLIRPKAWSKPAQGKETSAALGSTSKKFKP